MITESEVLKVRQLANLERLVEYVDQTDTRSTTTSGADFLDEVKRQMNALRKDLGLPVEPNPVEMAMMISDDVITTVEKVYS